MCFLRGRGTDVFWNKDKGFVLPWVGVGMPLKYEESNPSNFSLNLGYRIETVGFDVDASRIVVRAKDCKYELAFGI